MAAARCCSRAGTAHAKTAARATRANPVAAPLPTGTGPRRRATLALAVAPTAVTTGGTTTALAHQAVPRTSRALLIWQARARPATLSCLPPASLMCMRVPDMCYRYDGPAQDRSPRAVSPLMTVTKPPVQVPLPMGPPPGGLGASPGMPSAAHFGMPGAQPPTMMYAHAGGVPPATFHMGHNPYGPATHVPTPEMMYQQGPPRANSYSGPSFPHPNAASVFQQRASLPAGPPPPAQHYYF